MSFELRNRIDFSGLFGISPSRNGSAKSSRTRDVSPLQFEPEICDESEEMSMEALHYFGLESTPVGPGSTCVECPKIKKRQRHFSLEDYSVMDESEDSNLSGSSNILSNKRVRQGSLFFSGDDSTVGFSDSPNSSPSDFLSLNFSENSMSLELDNDHIAQKLRLELESRLLEMLVPGPNSRCKFSFELPPQLLSIIASHIIQEAANEPYGLKGCVLHIYFESESDCEFVSTLVCDPDTVSTFELTLTLRQETRKRSWKNKIPDLMRSFSAFHFGSVLIGTSYKLVKRRNYRSGEDELTPTL